MQPVDQEWANDATAQEAVARCVLSVGTLEAVRDLVQRMIAQLPLRLQRQELIDDIELEDPDPGADDRLFQDHEPQAEKDHD